MRTIYTDLDIQIEMDDTIFHVLNIVSEKFLRSMPKHSHGSTSYELHYIPYGYGTVHIDSKKYEITPNTLYMTGPHVEHEQIPSKNDPMVEYCIYFIIQKDFHSQHTNQESIPYKFTRTSFWFGQDTQELYPLLQQIFFELDHQYTGYTSQVKALLSQLIVKLVRNYENKQHAKLLFSPSNLVDSKYIIVEESFLYEYGSLTLKGLAAKLGLGTRQTERFLKEYYGKTFLQKKTEAKMSVAKVYLENSTLTISEIANKLNYSSIQHFSYAFKQYYGIPATQYRSLHAIPEYAGR